MTKWAPEGSELMVTAWLVPPPTMAAQPFRKTVRASGQREQEKRT